MLPGTLPPDDLSGWTPPPPAAQLLGDTELLRVFDSAEAMAFLARHVAGTLPGHRLPNSVASV